MFLLFVVTFWLGFGFLLLTLASRSRKIALLLPLLGMTPRRWRLPGAARSPLCNMLAARGISRVHGR
jgi:hypothetical protein